MLFSAVDAVQSPRSNIRVAPRAGPRRTDPINNCRTEPRSIFRPLCVVEEDNSLVLDLEYQRENMWGRVANEERSV